MPVPVLKQGDSLISSIQSALTDADLTGLRDDLLQRVGRHGSVFNPEQTILQSR